MNLHHVARALGGEVSDDQVLCPGPGHSAKDRSLSVKIDHNNPDDVICHSHAGDPWKECKDYVRQKLGMPPFEPNGKSEKTAESGPRRLVASYDYVDERGEPQFQVRRYDPKGFSQHCSDGNGGWLPKLGDARRVLYHLPELLETIAKDGTVFIVEGEKKVEALAKLNVIATCCCGGSGSWEGHAEDYARHFKGADVVIIPDADKPGEKYCDEVGRSLQCIAQTVSVLRLPGLAPAGDICNWLEAGGTAKDPWALAEKAPDWKPGDAAPETDANEKPLIISSGLFVADFTPPDYLIDKIVLRRYAYACTGRTGDGKTAVLLRASSHIALNLGLGNHEVMRGRVLYLAGENPDDIKMRWIAMAHEMKFDPHTIDVHFIKGRFSISNLRARVAEEVHAIGGIDLVAVDTSSTYFEDDDENNNIQMRNHALMLRDLTTLPGGPSVVAACHPVKNATNDNMLPRGGGAFLNEMDGNLTCIKNGTIAEVHWQGKFRGCDFAPISFQLHTASAPRLVDSRGHPIKTVMALPVTDTIKAEIEAVAESDQDSGALGAP